MRSACIMWFRPETAVLTKRFVSSSMASVTAAKKRNCLTLQKRVEVMTLYDLTSTKKFNFSVYYIAAVGHYTRESTNMDSNIIVEREPRST